VRNGEGRDNHIVGEVVVGGCICGMSMRRGGTVCYIPPRVDVLPNCIDDIPNQRIALHFVVSRIIQNNTHPIVAKYKIAIYHIVVCILVSHNAISIMRQGFMRVRDNVIYLLFPMPSGGDPWNPRRGGGSRSPRWWSCQRHG